MTECVGEAVQREAGESAELPEIEDAEAERVRSEGAGAPETGGREGEAAERNRERGGARAEAGSDAGTRAAALVQAPQSCERPRVRGTDARDTDTTAQAAESAAPPRCHSTEVRIGFIVAS